MIVTRSRVKTVGWAAVLACCAGAVTMLAFKVNAVRSEVRQAEERIVQLERDNLYLETEFETRASQQQLAALNRMEFGYVAPGPAQFLANERALAAFSAPRSKDAPEMIRVAREDVAEVELASFTEDVDAARPEPEKKPERKPAEPTEKAPSFQHAVVEKVKAEDKAEPSFAALFANYRLDKEAAE